jgi:hypothetical protein
MEQIKVKNYSSDIEAEMGKNLLSAHGIKSFVQTNGIHSSGIPTDNMGADLYVFEKDIEQAKNILENTAE